MAIKNISRGSTSIIGKCFSMTFNHSIGTKEFWKNSESSSPLTPSHLRNIIFRRNCFFITLIFLPKCFRFGFARLRSLQGGAPKSKSTGHRSFIWAWDNDVASPIYSISPSLFWAAVTFNASLSISQLKYFLTLIFKSLKTR